jgi:2-methylcitrate dehydratase PrpD
MSVETAGGQARVDETAGDQASTALAAQLAAKICAFTDARITPRAYAQAHASFADTIGVALAGVGEDCTRLLLTTPGLADAPGQATLFAGTRRTSALDAAMVNATASHALDFDDVSSVLGGHPSAPIVAPVLALAEERGLSGTEVLVAYVAGVETACCLARGVHTHHYDKGWHPTATLGVFGVAAAIARLLKLDKARTALALGIAASFASGLKANFGTMTKPLHVGQTARNGLLAALLAERGYTGNPHALDHKQGFLHVFNGAGTFDAARIVADWGDPLEVGSDALGLKEFPCCGSAQPAIAMALDMVRTERFAAEDIETVDVLVPMRGLRHTDRPAPSTVLEAKFSVQYAVACALVHGGVTLGHFTDEALRDERVRGVMQRVWARAQPDAAHGMRHWGADVMVMLKDGRRLARKVDNLVGRSGDNAMTAAERRAKFQTCAGRALPRAQVTALYAALQDLRAITDIRTLTKLLAK